jgi:hypothetical protein
MTTIEKLDEPIPAEIGGLQSGSRRDVFFAGQLAGYVISDAGPATLGAAEITSLDRDRQGVVVGACLSTEAGTALAVYGSHLGLIFPAKGGISDEEYFADVR